MSDLGKVVQKLTETNVRLETLEKQNKESGTAASIIAASLPEVLSDRNVAKNRESFDKDQGITGTDDDVRTNTKILGKKLDKLNMGGKRDGDGNLIKPTNTGADEEEDSDRTKALKKVFSPLTKSFNVVSKSITGFIGGMAKTVTGGASLFLKGIITASVLGLIIKFLQSDYFKDFLSEENLNKLADFFKNMGVYMNQLFDYLADKTNPLSIAFAIAAGAGIFLAGGLIAKIVGGVVGTFKFLRKLGALFGIGGALSATATAAGTTSVATAAGGIGLLGTAAVIAGVALLAKMSYDGIAAAQKSYMEGDTFGRVVAKGVAGFFSFLIGDDLALKLQEFLSPSKEGTKTIKENEVKESLKSLEDLQKRKKELQADTIISGKDVGKIKPKNFRKIVELDRLIKAEKLKIENNKKVLENIKPEDIANEKNKAAILAAERLSISEFNDKKDAFIKKRKKEELDKLLLLKKNKKINKNDFDVEFQKIMGMNSSILNQKLNKEFKSLNVDPRIKIDESRKQIEQAELTIKNQVLRLKAMNFKENMEKGRDRFAGGNSFMNIVNQSDTKNIKNEVGAKPVTPSIAEQYILSST